MSQTEYCLGRFKLQPRRQLTQDGVRIPIGRKALDLLSALAEAEGELVTKDELVIKVWPQAVVDDNTLQVQVATARKALGEDAKLLSTVHGLGYRLDVSAPLAPLTAVPSSNDQAMKGGPRDRTIWTIGAIGLIAVAVAATLLIGRRGDEGGQDVLIAVAPFQPHGQDGAMREFSNGLSEKVASALSTDHLQVASAVTSRPSRRWSIIPDRQDEHTDLRIAGAVWKSGSAYDIYAHLDDPRQGLVIWSDEFQGSTSTSDAALQTSIAARIAEAAYWANVGRSGSVKLAPPALAAFIAGREGTTGLRDSAAILTNYQKVASLSPNFSWGHSAIAAQDGFMLLEQPTLANAQSIRTAGQAEAQRALSLDKHNGEAYLALELLAPRPQWKRRESYLLKGANLDKSFGPVALMEGRLLEASGRDHAATSWLELAHELSPLHNGATLTLVLNQAALGNAVQSKALLDQMKIDWPDHSATKDAEFWSRLTAGDTSGAAAMLADPKTRPAEMDQVAVATWKSVLQATLSGDPKAKTHAAQQVGLATKTNSLGHGEALVLLAMIGDLDAGFMQAQQYEFGEPIDPPYLFLPLTKPMRMDRRFMVIAHRLGLVSYWRSTGVWPDFCNEPGLPYDCRAEASSVELRNVSGSSPE